MSMEYEKIDHSWGQEWRFSNPNHFFAALRPSALHWMHGYTHAEWIFRGQSDSSHSLIPTLFRPRLPNPFGALLYARQREVQQFFTKSLQHAFAESDWVIDAVARTILEEDLIYDFCTLADDLAMEVTRHPFGERWESLTGDQGVPCRYPNAKYLCNESGLARHHGLPSRLLDWTKHPYYALHFAVEYQQATLPSQHIAVWAIDQKLIQQSRSGIKLFACERHRNSYLNHQQGVFLHDERLPFRSIDAGRHVPFEEILALSDYGRKNPTSIKQLTIHYQWAPMMRILLNKEGITKARLMPTFDNVAQTVINRAIEY